MERTTAERPGTAPPHRSPAVPRSPRCTHVAALVPSHEALVAAALPFLERGLGAGELTVLACAPATVEELRGRLGEGAVALEADGGLRVHGRRAPDTMASARALVARAEAEGRRVRLLGEVPVATDPLDWREGQRCESAVNAILRAAPLSVLCLYDRSAHPPEVIDGVPATHPLLLDGGLPRSNPAFQEPERFLRALPVPREPAEVRPPVFSLDDAPTLPALRHALRAVLEERVTDDEQFDDLYLAVSEVAANAFRHGARPVSARVWADGERIVCTVTDGGHRFDDPLAGFVPAHGDDLTRGGMGLWLARKLWDSVDLLRGEGGLTVRLSTRLR